MGVPSVIGAFADMAKKQSHSNRHTHPHAQTTNGAWHGRVQSLPDPVMQDVVRLFQALSDFTRARIIYALTTGEWNVNDLAAHVGVSPTAASHHPRRLRDARLVSFHRHGNQVLYSIEDAHVAALFEEAVNHIDHAHS